MTGVITIRCNTFQGGLKQLLAAFPDGTRHRARVEGAALEQARALRSAGKGWGTIAKIISTPAQPLSREAVRWALQGGQR